DASAFGSWRTFRPSGPPLEPEEGLVHLRTTQQHPHRRSPATRPNAHSAASAGQRYRAQGRPHPFRRHQPPGTGLIADAAKRSAQYYVNSRWLGGTLTNWKTISASIARLRKLDEMVSSGEAAGYTKKERLTMQRERDKLDRSLGGIKDMGGVPDLLFV